MPDNDYMDFLQDGLCNCYDCRRERSMNESQVTAEEFFGFLGYIPLLYRRMYGASRRNFILRMGDMEPGIRIKMLEQESSSLQRKNEVIADVLRQDGVSNGSHRYCHHCGGVTAIDPARKIRVDNRVKYFCEHCAGKLYAKCISCGSYHPVTGSRGGRNYLVMSRHYGNSAVLCNECRASSRSQNRNLSSCSSCGGAAFIDDSVEIRNQVGDITNRICPACRDNVYGCSECGSEFVVSTGQRPQQIDGEVWCNDCMRNNRPILNYSHRPQIVPRFDEKMEKLMGTSMMYGLELETENSEHSVDRDTMALAIKRKFFERGFLYCKSDGSIRDGFEVVTHPFTWQHYRKERASWDKLLDYLMANGYNSYDSGRCGIHVHMNKRAFGTHQLYKFLDFFYNKRNRKMMDILSQRQGRCQYARFGLGDNLKHNAKYKENSCGNRYTVVNITPMTVEVRMFRGTLNKRSFHKNLEFLRSLYVYSKDCSRHSMNVPEYWEWLTDRKNIGQYRNLVNFVSNKGRKVLTHYDSKPATSKEKK